MQSRGGGGDRVDETDSRTTDGRTEAAGSHDNLAGSQLRQSDRRVIKSGSKDRADSVPSVRDGGSDEVSSETDSDGDGRRLNGDDKDKDNDNDSEEEHDSDRLLEDVCKQLGKISLDAVARHRAGTRKGHEAVQH